MHLCNFTHIDYAPLMNVAPPPDLAKTTQLVQGIVFTALGLLLVTLGLVQFSYYLGGVTKTLTIEPIVIPVGLIFFIPGSLHLRRYLINRTIDQQGILADAQLLRIEHTKARVQGAPVVKLSLRVNSPSKGPHDVTVRWLMRPMDGIRLVEGSTVRVKIHPTRENEVGLA
jgi:hypothetical protein